MLLFNKLVDKLKFVLFVLLIVVLKLVKWNILSSGLKCFLFGKLVILVYFKIFGVIKLVFFLWVSLINILVLSLISCFCVVIILVVVVVEIIEFMKGWFFVL